MNISPCLTHMVARRSFKIHIFLRSQQSLFQYFLFDIISFARNLKLLEKQIWVENHSSLMLTLLWFQACIHVSSTMPKHRPNSSRFGWNSCTPFLETIFFSWTNIKPTHEVLCYPLLSPDGTKNLCELLQLQITSIGAISLTFHAFFQTNFLLDVLCLEILVISP